MTRTILRADEVSQRTGVPVQTLKYWRAHGRGPRWYKLGRRVVYDLDAVDAWVDESRRAAATS